jgi:hypothetical protein
VFYYRVFIWQVASIFALRILVAHGVAPHSLQSSFMYANPHYICLWIPRASPIETGNPIHRAGSNLSSFGSGSKQINPAHIALPDTGAWQLYFE